ncbi:unnamed protein product [Urochloa decumbens]|uniref:Uncharacterized protein n=1 Tax=Urochloa decumbens TaxID=240449 RepID=A0ABC8XNC4_9POAL
MIHPLRVCTERSRGRRNVVDGERIRSPGPQLSPLRRRDRRFQDGIVIKTPGLGEVLSWRSLGPIFSYGADLKGGVLLRTKVAASTPAGYVDVLNRKGRVLHRMEFRTKKIASCFRTMRYTLTTWVEQFEAGRKESDLYYLIPPDWIIWYRDLFERVCEWERFFPVDDLIYLEEYYRRNGKAIGRQQTSFNILAIVYPHREKNVARDTQSDATTRQQQACSANGDDYLVTNLVNLEVELASEWRKQRLGAASEIRLSIRILEKGLNFMLQKGDRPIIPDVIHDCLKCIMKEAELILERLKKGLNSNHYDNKLSHRIRTQAFRLVEKYLRADPCSASVSTRAILLEPRRRLI